MGWLLGLVEHLTFEPVPSVPSPRNMMEQLKPAQVRAVPSVPLQKSKFQSESRFSTHSAAARQVWLSNVAQLLGCSPDYLLVHGFIDSLDLDEQRAIFPCLAAQLIQRHPNWIVVATPAPPFLDNSSAAVQLCAYTTSTEWRHARDLYIGHLMICRSCYAPTGHYCRVGSQLRAQYNAPTVFSI
jgi:hypothetical protein